MYREFAIDPVLLTDSYDRACKLLDVGWHKGKLIGCMPDDWAKQVIKRLKLREMERKRIVHQLTRAKKAFIARASIPEPGVTWFNAALAEHNRQDTDRFAAIISTEEQAPWPHVLNGYLLGPNVEQWAVDTNVTVQRTPQAMTEAISMLLRCSTQIHFVDPYVDPKDRKGLEPIMAFINEALQRDRVNKPKAFHLHVKRDPHPSATSAPARPYEQYRNECRDYLPKRYPNFQSLGTGVELHIFRWLERETTGHGAP